MDKIVRPETMERITTTALAEKFIEQEVKKIKEQVKDNKEDLEEVA